MARNPATAYHFYVHAAGRRSNYDLRGPTFYSDTVPDKKRVKKEQKNFIDWLSEGGQHNKRAAGFQHILENDMPVEAKGRDGTSFITRLIKDAEKGYGYQSFKHVSLQTLVRKRTGKVPRKDLDVKTLQDLASRKKFGASFFED